MDNKKKINRWLSQILRCYEQTNAIIAQAQQARRPALLAHCHERLQFLAAREQVLQKRMGQLERQLEQELADANKRWPRRNNVWQSPATTRLMRARNFSTRSTMPGGSVGKSRSQ